MTWTERIKVGMELIKEGCESNRKWSGCNDCPFGEVCDQLIDGAVSKDDTWEEALLPDKWELVD